MKISIVTPSWNQAGYLKEAIDSVLVQSDPQVEHVIFDNCSTDGTADVLKQYPQVKAVIAPDKGQSDALNKGFKVAQGEIIGWLNADDKYLPGCFKAVTDFFAAHPDCDIVYGNYRLIDGDGKLLSMRKELAFDLFMLKYLHILCIPSTTVFFRRRIFEEGNFLDPDYHYSMDYEFFVRLAVKGYRFYHIDAYLADFRTYADSKSQRQTQKQLQELETALVAHDPFLKGLNPSVRVPVRKMLMILARLKRSILKLIHGAYCQ